MRRVRYPLFFPRGCVRSPLVRSHGKRRYQAFSDGSTWDQLGTGLEAMQLSPYHAGLASLRLSAPFLRIPLFRHALFPSAFRRQVRRLTSGTFPRFPDHLCGDMKLVVTAHAEAVGRRLHALVGRSIRRKRGHIIRYRSFLTVPMFVAS